MARSRFVPHLSVELAGTAQPRVARSECAQRPIAAMNTGGTSDVIADDETGLLSSSARELAEDVARLASDAGLRERLGAAAGKRAELRFDMPIVVSRMERLYEDLVV